MAVPVAAGSPVTVAQLESRLLALREAVPEASRKALGTLGHRSTEVLVRGLLSGNRLAVRSGLLRNSVGMKVTATASGYELEVFAGRDARVRYAAIQEFGGVVRPKRGRFLAIPVGPARTGAGVTKGGWESPRTAPVKLRFVPIRGGTMGRLVMDQRGKSTTAYLLVRSVRIKPKHYMRDTQAAAQAAFPDLFADALAKRLR